MKWFNFKDFFAVGEDQSIADNQHNLMVKMCPQGLELIAKYYAKKYRAEISFSDKNTANFCYDAEQFIARARKRAKGLDNYREALIVGYTGTHAAPIIYIKEKGEEGILYADSKGVKKPSVREMQKNTKIRVFAVEETRQSDEYSCYVDAILTSLNATAKDQEGTYRIPGLLQALASRATHTNGYSIAKLPDGLLKTAQISDFVGTHKQDSDEIVHAQRGENLRLFRQRYSQTVLMRMKSKGGYFLEDEQGQPILQEKTISSYLRKKGIKLAGIIEIQFYIDELSHEVGWSDTIREQFIKEAKIVFSKTPFQKENPERLHETAEKFLLALRNSVADEKRLDQEHLENFPQKQDEVVVQDDTEADNKHEDIMEIIAPYKKAKAIQTSKPDERIVFSTLTAAQQQAVIALKNFRSYDMQNANLQNTNLHGANFTGVNISGTDFKNAELHNANLAFARGLRESKNLVDATGIGMISQASEHDGEYLRDIIQLQIKRVSEKKEAAKKVNEKFIALFNKVLQQAIKNSGDWTLRARNFAGKLTAIDYGIRTRADASLCAHNDPNSMVARIVSEIEKQESQQMQEKKDQATATDFFALKRTVHIPYTAIQRVLSDTSVEFTP